MSFALNRRVRGFRLVNLICGALLLTTVLGVYLTKSLGGDQKSQITAVEREIQTEQKEIRLLKAEVSYLARPERLQTLAEGSLGLAPIAADRRITGEELARLAAPPPPPPPPAPVLSEAAAPAAPLQTAAVAQ